MSFDHLWFIKEAVEQIKVLRMTFLQLIASTPLTVEINNNRVKANF